MRVHCSTVEMYMLLTCCGIYSPQDAPVASTTEAVSSRPQQNTISCREQDRVSITISIIVVRPLLGATTI